MKNKAISLIMIIPLVLMFCVFSASNIASLNVPIAVSSVSVFHDEQEVVNLVEGNEFQINAQVYPKNASNKGLNYSYETVNKGFTTEELFLEISETGLVKAKGCGTAKITVETKDGAYKKSFILEVVSTKATDLIANVNKIGDIFVGDKFSYLAKVIPETALDKNVKFSSSNPNVLKINPVTGECNAISNGKAIIKAVVENGLKGKIEKSEEIIVYPKQTSSLITFEGKENVDEDIFSDEYIVDMDINFTEEYTLGKTLTRDDIIFDYDESKISAIELSNWENNNGVYKSTVKITGIEADFNLKVSVNYGDAKNYYSEINLNKVVDLKELKVNVSGLKNYIKLNSTNNFTVDVLPKDFINYDVVFTSSNNNISVQKTEGGYSLAAHKLGESELTIELFYQDEKIDVDILKQTIKVLNPPTSINFSESSKTYGIENLLTIANKQIIKSDYVDYKQKFGFTTSVNIDNIQFESSDESVARFNKNKELEILSDGKVTIIAREQESKLLGNNVSCEINIRCVKGVNVSSYKDLVIAVEDDKQVVLTNDIMLGEKLINVKDDGTTSLIYSQEKSAEILKSEINQMKTTADWNYYKNGLKYSEPPEINYIIKFTNNCFGNGYYLNANNITNCLKGDTDKVAIYDFAKFRGPLDLVAIAGASVKAQDNICFIASDNVVINNVELIGSDLRGDSVTDLNQLKYTGTVLEVMGDNVKVVNSRIRNGRNCIRVYGKEYGDLSKINVYVASSIISHAREFLIKLGTNKKLEGNYTGGSSIYLKNGNLDDKYWEECSPSLNGLTHLNKGNLTLNQYNNLVKEYLSDKTYQDLVNTTLTLENSVLHTSGLFSVGVESSFAGPALDGARWSTDIDFAKEGWLDIAGTSYPAQLNLEGNVKIYDWKKLSHIDSTILLEGDMFKLDFASMINNLYDEGKFNDIITIVGGEKYAHGGIVMYGGGKNYSLVNDNTTTEKLNNYSISLDSLNNSLTTMLKYASGKENFRVLMYGKNSTFNYYKQASDMLSGLAYKVEAYTL